MDIGETVRMEVATGGELISALAAAYNRWVPKGPYVFYCGVSHDEECACLIGLPMIRCTCEIVGLDFRRIA